MLSVVPRWSALPEQPLNPLAQTSMPTQQHETLQKVKSTCFECGALVYIFLDTNGWYPKPSAREEH